MDTIKEILKKALSNVTTVVIIALIVIALFFFFRSSVNGTKVENLTYKLSNEIQKNKAVKQHTIDSLAELQLMQRDTLLMKIINNNTVALDKLTQQNNIIYEKYKQASANYSGIIVNRPDY
jgi:predicted PurR-regulated permease PerM